MGKWENEMLPWKHRMNCRVVDREQTNKYKEHKKKHEIVEAKRLYLHKNKIEKENINANE